MTMNQTEKEILDEITRFYLDSRDFNGLPLNNETLRKEESSLVYLITNNFVTLNWDPDNPHIKRLPDQEIAFQLNKLKELQENKIKANEVCLYPSKKCLKNKVANNKFSNRPFERLLLLGNSQLEPLYFDPSILYEFRDKPTKYELSITGVSGSLMYKKKKSSFVRAFGFGLSQDLEHYEICIAAFTRYLADLEPLDQKIWKEYKLPNQAKFFLHPDYAIMSMGSLDFKASMYTAFLEEIKVTNQMTKAVFGKKLFREEYLQKDVPLFSYILIPSVKEYFDFSKLLNNIFIDNIDKEFFKDFDIPDYKDKGTICLLEEWLAKHFSTENTTDMEEMFNIIRKDIRKTRSKSSHKEHLNDEDIKYFTLQRDLMRKAYKAIRTLRLIFTNFSGTQSVEVSKWLFEGRIRQF